ncbi:MAG: ABC transporter ATP-binding protein [Chloroflexi bacterium]|nr:ABC transporter ATP-binding protein [Chloroflexota bacterium]
MIKARGLTKYYGRRLAIDHLTFEAHKGEIVGFLGPNGAGKTTTMRILTGYMPPSDGDAWVAGYHVVDESLEVRRRVGYLPENVALYDDMTVWDYLRFMGQLRQVPDLDERIAEVLERVNLLERSESFIGSLSRGMRQRVGLAQAILHRPEVLILDEPTMGLDPAQRVEVRDLIREIGQEHTVMLSTHILSEAQELCDRVLIINEGRILAEDTPEELELRLRGAQRVRLQVSGPASAAELQTRLAALPGVLQVHAADAQHLEVELAPDAGRDLRPVLARAVLDAGYDLHEMCTVSLSLEDIFLQLIREEGASDQEAAAAEPSATTEAASSHPASEADEEA